VCNRPTRGLGAGAVKYIREVAEMKSSPDCKVSLYASANLLIKDGHLVAPSGKKLGLKQQNALKKFLSIASQITEATAKSKDLQEVIDFTVKITGYAEHLKKKQSIPANQGKNQGSNSKAREDNLEELKKRAQAFVDETAKADAEVSGDKEKGKGQDEQCGTRQLRLFLEWLHLQNAGEDTLEEGRKAQNQNVVSMTTIHQAKGLEWPVGK